MVRSILVWAAAFLMAALTCLDQPCACALEAPANPVLEKHGLKMAGTLAVVNEEAEIKAKLTEARQLSKQLSRSLMQQQGTASPQEMQKTIKNLGTQINQLRSEMNSVNQQMSRVPRNNSRYGGRYARGAFVNNDAAAMYSQFMAYRNQLQMEINQESYFLNQLRSQPADPKAKERIDSEVRDRRDAYHQAVLDLRGLADAAIAKYDEAKTDDEVKKTLDYLGKGLREKPKLGPSHEFLANIKLIEKLERAESSGETEHSYSKSHRRSRHGARTKQDPSKSADASGDSK